MVPTQSTRHKMKAVIKYSKNYTKDIKQLVYYMECLGRRGPKFMSWQKAH